MTDESDEALIAAHENAAIQWAYDTRPDRLEKLAQTRKALADRLSQYRGREGSPSTKEGGPADA